MMFRWCICLLIGIAMSGMFCAEASAQDYKLSLKAKRYLLTIDKVEKSTPEAEGLSQQQYDQWLGTLYFLLSTELYENDYLEVAQDGYAHAMSYFIKAGDAAMQIMVSRAIGDIAYHLKKYDQAQDAWENAYALASQNDDDDSMAEVLLSLYDLALHRNDIDEAYRILVDLKSLAGSELSVSTKLSLLSSDFKNAMRIGDYDMSLLYLEQYRKLIESMPEQYRAGQMNIYNIHRSNYLMETENYREVAQVYENSLADEESSSALVMTYAMTLDCYARDGDKAKVHEYRDKISDMEEYDDISDVTWGMVRTYLISAYMQLGMYDDALQQVLRNEASGLCDGTHYTYKGSILHHLGRNEEARECFRIQLKNCLDTNGRDSKEYADALRNLANIEGFCGDLESGMLHYIESMDLMKSIIRRELPYISYDRLEEYWSNVSDGFLEMSAWALEAKINNGAMTVSAYEALVMFKGFLLSSQMSFSDYVRKSGDENLQNLYKTATELRERMEDLKKSYSQNGTEIMELQSQLSLVETELTMAGSVFSGYDMNLDVTYNALRSCLKDNEVVIDFVDNHSDRYGRRYAAFIYRGGWDSPVLVPVCTHADLESYHISGNRPDYVYGRKYSSRLMDLIWKPLEQYVNEKDMVYIIPSGELHLVSFDSFQLPDRTLLGDKYNFVRLSSAREILSGIDDTLSGVKTAALYGGLQYDMTDAERIGESEKYKRSVRRLRTRVNRGGEVEKYNELPLSRDEAVYVAQRLQSAGIKTECYLGKEGTEESFLNLGAPSPDIIHMSTHGFCFSPEAAFQVKGLSGYKNAMRLSGLVLAGGNAEWAGSAVPENTLGGILTADDIAQCDLSGTELVVLAACDTGKGKVTSEGVYGLQRAFKMAGVKCIILNLWKADDSATTCFFEFFYTALTENGWNRREAFRSAKNSMRQKYSSPYYWAGIIMLD